MKSEAATGGVPQKKGAFENFAKFTGKDLCQSIFVNKVAGLGTIKVQASGLQLC